MGNFLYGGKRPTRIIYQGKEVQTLKFNGVVVWQRGDVYTITGTVLGKGIDNTWYNCTSGSHSQECDCDCTETDWQYRLQLTFTGVTRFPIKYVSKSGATVSLEKTAVSGSGTTYTYTSAYLNDGFTSGESYNASTGVNVVKSIYPASGVSGYSSISSINIGAKNEGTTNCGNAQPT